MTHEIGKIHKYAARIPNPEYTRAQEKCRRLDISMNQGLIHALRHWCDSVPDNAPIPVHQKLSDVIQGMLQEMEARLIAAISGSPEYVVSMDVAFAPSAASEPAYQQEPLAQPVGTRMALTREGASFVLPEQHLTVPGALEWDPPAGAPRLWPDNPPVDGLSPVPLRGQVWVITGGLDSMTRDRAREILMAAGATVAGAVNKRTSAVLSGHGYNGEKLDNAEVHGTPIWTELQFLHMAHFIGADVRIPE